MKVLFLTFFPLKLTILWYQKKKKEIIERSRDELPIAEKEIDHKKKVSKSFLANEEIEIKKTYFYVV